jgi:hypothetical protein
MIAHPRLGPFRAQMKRRLLRQYLRPTVWYEGLPKATKFILVMLLAGFIFPMAPRAYGGFMSAGNLLRDGIEQGDPISLVVALIQGLSSLIVIASTGIAVRMIAIENERIVKDQPERTRTLRYLGRALRTLNLIGLALILLYGLAVGVFVTGRW